MSEELDALLKMYREEIKKFTEANAGEVVIRIPLTPEFLKVCEERIIRGHEQYGDDWKYKDSLKERDMELFDYVNYTILDACKKRLF